MKKQSRNKKRIFKFIISFTLALALVFEGMPLEMIPEEIAEQTGIVMSVKAVEDLDAGALAALTAKYTDNSYSFTSGGTELSEYSKCFQDPAWAADHANDILTLNPVENKFVFDGNYRPIGNASAPFKGTIIYNTSAEEFAVEANGAIFDYVYDAVKLQKVTVGTNIPININRVADVGSTISPLFAVHVVGSDAEAPCEWKVTLNSASAHSYSGVIYEMSNGAKVNLTFKDDSTHTPGTDSNGKIASGSIIANNEDDKNYGILCGKITDSSELTATYTNTAKTPVTFIGTESAYCGGLIGEINNSTFKLLDSSAVDSSAVKVDFQTAKKQVGFICGHAEDSTITLPTDYTFSGTVKGNHYAGGIAGYCRNTTINYKSSDDESSSTITLDGCTIEGGDAATGGVFGYYECNAADKDILINSSVTRKFSLTNCKIQNCAENCVCGGIAGEYNPTYSSAITIDLNNFTFNISNTKLNSGTSAGGLFGKYTAPGSVTITDSDTDTDFTPPSSTIPYGGVIGEYINTDYANTLTLNSFIIKDLSATSSRNVGGVIRVLNGQTYVKVSDVLLTNVTANNAGVFGGIVSTLDDSNAGSFIDITGNFTFSTATGKTYKGGAIAGSFKTGVIRLAGVTDISGAEAANGYAQLVYENDETLVYAKGSGSDAWTLKRNASTTASDLGQWGEVVRLFKVDGEYKNAEEAGIVSVADNKVTIAQGVTGITDTVSFAKCALNMQLNDGSDHGALCFADKETYPKSELLGSTLTVSGEIDLSGTGLLGFMRDGGNGKYLDGSNNTFSSNIDFFKGSVTGSDNAEIKLAVGESYGIYADNSTGTGGKIYLSENYGHDAQGLFAFADGANITSLKVSGSISVERNAGSNYLYTGALFGAITGNSTLSGVEITTGINTTRANNARFYIGGVSGVSDGKTASTLTVKERSIIKPTITLNGKISCVSAYSDGNLSNCNNTYCGGVLGLLKGADTVKYNVSIESSEISPTITTSGEDNPDTSYLGGMIGRISHRTINKGYEHEVKINNVTMTSPSLTTHSKYPGGLLGMSWESTDLTIDGLTIGDTDIATTVSHAYNNGTGSKQSGLVFRGTGKWDINSLSISNTTFSSADTQPVSFGLIVNEAYSGNDGLYINLLNRGYKLANVTVPTNSTYDKYHVDEIAANTKNNDSDKDNILVCGNGNGIVNINMNAEGESKTKITETGTYQNRLYGQLNPNNLVANQNTRYYYNLDVMLNKGTKGDAAPGGEQFLLWSVRRYAAGNIQKYFKDNDNMIKATDIDLTGLSYYPLKLTDNVTLPTGATITFGFSDIKELEKTSSTPDNCSRQPDHVGDPKSADARNQHYLMQTGLFTALPSRTLSATNLTLKGDFGYVEKVESGALIKVASGALINGTTYSSLTISGLTLGGLKPSDPASYMLVNTLDAGNSGATWTISNVRAIDYEDKDIKLPVAQSLFGMAKGTNLKMTFSNIKLDARDGDTPTGSGWKAEANSAMTATYGTSRSIFSTATFFTELLTNKTSAGNIIYNYTKDEDWEYINDQGSNKEFKRNVTYGKEITESKEYQGKETKYYLEGDGTRKYTTPVENSEEKFDFSKGFLPYVANYENKGADTTYPVCEIKVNVVAASLVDGCGTYNDPYIITGGDQLELIADTINGADSPAKIRLPNEYNADKVSTSWHGEKGCGLYTKSGNNYNKDTTNPNGFNNNTWTLGRVRLYLASAYYVISNDIELSADFSGLGAPTTSGTTGDYVFHGVIVGKKTDGSAPTVTNKSQYPLIYISNGSVVKNLKIKVTENISKSLSRTGDNALYGYMRNPSPSATKSGAEYYGGVIGEIMGGDNVIDDVTVTYTGTTTLAGDYKHIIAEGGMVGCVVNGALIFRGSNSVSDRAVTGGGIYSNPIVGRVINGYAVYEKIDGRDGTAPTNTNTDGNIYYHIDTIVRKDKDTEKLDVNYSDSTITVPDAQALYIMSLITQSIAGTAGTSGNEEYGGNSPSYGYNGYVTGVARLGDYTDVGCGTNAEQPDDYPNAEQPDDYSKYAYRDSVNNYYSASAKTDLLNAPVPYIIYRYTKPYETDTTIISKNFPARKMTSDTIKDYATKASSSNAKFFTITLDKNGDFTNFDRFAAFRGIGSAFVRSTKVSMKVKEFNGNDQTLKLNIKMHRYIQNQENVQYGWATTLTQSPTMVSMTSAEYGQDTNSHMLIGLGLFDMTLTESQDTYFKNLTIGGCVEDHCYESNGTDARGKHSATNVNCTNLYGVGGIVGHGFRYYNQNFDSIKLDGLNVESAYAAGGLLGLVSYHQSDTDTSGNRMTVNIKNCQAVGDGVTVTGGEYEKQNNGTSYRHGVGAFVGMTVGSKISMNGNETGELDENGKVKQAEIKINKITTFNTSTDNAACCVGGLVGYTGAGAEISNIKLSNANDSSFIGSDIINGKTATVAAAFVAFAQRDNANNGDIIVTNCSVENLNIYATKAAGAVFGKSWDGDKAWCPTAMQIKDCAIISTNGSKIMSIGVGDQTSNVAGGLTGSLAMAQNTHETFIDNCYVKGYTIQGYVVGGLFGSAFGNSNNNIIVKNSYAQDCIIISNEKSDGTAQPAGGLFGYSDGKNIDAYNIAIYDIDFKTNSGKDNTDNSGAFLGANNNNDRVDKFIGIGAYHTTPSKVPAVVVKNNGTNGNNFFVFADYLNASSTDIANKSGGKSTFNADNNVEQPKAPYVTVNPRMAMGTDEYLTGDGASVGNIGEIYKDAFIGTSNRKYTIETENNNANKKKDTSVGNVKDSVTLAKYINEDGTYKEGAFKISTASDVFSEDFAELTDVDDFAMLVINDDSDKTNDITPFIKSYIRLVTNAAGSSNSNTFNPVAYSCGNDAIDQLYQVIINPCYYDVTEKKFVLGTAGDQGLQMYSGNDINNKGKYYFDSSKADSESDNLYQFSLIDVQFKDPTDTTNTKIAYHLYVPVYTQKMPTAEFSAVSMSETKYYRKPYASRIALELAAHRSTTNPSQLVESTNEWTTTFIRYTYPKKQVSSSADWNYDKSIIIVIDSNFNNLPAGTALVLVDPNANADKFYTLTLEEAWEKGTSKTLKLSDFKDENDVEFKPQALKDIYADSGAAGTENGKEVLYEDYYISMYVPKADGSTHSVLFSSGTEMSHTKDDETYKANIEPKLNSMVVLGDLFEHSITSFDVVSGDGTTFTDPREMTNTNNVLKTNVTATVKIKNQSAGAYLANSNVYHSFYIMLTSHDEDKNVSDIIHGITSGYIKNTTTYSYTKGETNYSQTITDNSKLGANYIVLDTGSIINALYDPTSTPELTIVSETTMQFNDITAFPYNEKGDEKNGIGTQVSIKSSLAFREEDLRFSALNFLKEDPEGAFYYSATRNSAEFSFNAVPTDDDTDEIGLKTNNRSLLGVNGKYGTSHPIIGRSMYNVDAIVDYESAESLQYTIELYKKVTDANGTRYEKVGKISDYMTSVEMKDTKVTLTADKADESKYVYTGPIDHDHAQDNEKMFEAEFSCRVLTGDSAHNKYANYKIVLTAQLIGAKNSSKDDYLIYTNAKFDPSVIDD